VVILIITSGTCVRSTWPCSVYGIALRYSIKPSLRVARYVPSPCDLGHLNRPYATMLLLLYYTLSIVFSAGSVQHSRASQAPLLRPRRHLRLPAPQAVLHAHQPAVVAFRHHFKRPHSALRAAVAAAAAAYFARYNLGSGCQASRRAENTRHAAHCSTSCATPRHMRRCGDGAVHSREIARMAGCTGNRRKLDTCCSIQREGAVQWLRVGLLHSKPAWP